MRQERTAQATIFEIFAGHEIGCELKAISQWLDQQRALVSLVASDLRRHGLRETGRRGLPAETVLRCALLKQQRQLSYEELAFHLEDSASFRAFARLPLAWSPKKSVLHQTISAIRPASWRGRAVAFALGDVECRSGASDPSLACDRALRRRHAAAKRTPGSGSLTRSRWTASPRAPRGIIFLAARHLLDLEFRPRIR
jgi:hypothetical protein